MNYECIMGAFAKFAIFETRIFFQTRRSQVKKILTDFVFFSRFLYIYIYILLNNKVRCVSYAPHPHQPSHPTPPHPIIGWDGVGCMREGMSQSIPGEA